MKLFFRTLTIILCLASLQASALNQTGQVTMYKVDALYGDGDVNHPTILAESAKPPFEHYLNEFDWNKSLQLANQHEKFSPTLSFEGVNTDELLWISAVGNPGDYVFVIGGHYTGPKTSWFGLVKGIGKVIMHYDGLSPQKTKQLLQAFFKKDYDQVQSILKN